MNIYATEQPFLETISHEKDQPILDKGSKDV